MIRLKSVHVAHIIDAHTDGANSKRLLASATRNKRTNSLLCD